ncbi:hypothetical protein [Stratiformator vulcanicus]|uniref:hypothetical protein n=1 Tax=Stratiformator vulcanicus TaxID=2527980 RepID=UPI0011A7F2D9|nr:hypothetical protein [Stratiformator vulcanicus]
MIQFLEVSEALREHAPRVARPILGRVRGAGHDDDRKLGVHVTFTGDDAAPWEYSIEGSFAKIHSGPQKPILDLNELCDWHQDVREIGESDLAPHEVIGKRKS